MTLEVGRFYVGPKKGWQAIIRQVRNIDDDGHVYYKDYARSDGASVGSGFCQVKTIVQWIAREATEEEVARLHISANDLSYSNSILGWVTY